VKPYCGRRKVTPEKIGSDVLDSFLEQIEPVSFSEVEGEQVGRADYYIGCIDHLLETARKNQWDIGIKNEVPHFFDGKSWCRIDQQTFRHFLKAAGMRQGIPYRIAKDHCFVVLLVKQFASEGRFPVLTTKGTPKINLRNGTLHFTSNGTELKPFDKHDGLTYQLHYDFDSSAAAPLFDKFIKRVLPDETVRKLLFQYIGYVFLREMNLEKILFLFGGGANGKSVFLNIIIALIGSEQCSSYSLERLTNSDYYRAQLGDYILNVCTEISPRMKTDVFKQMASRESLSARSPYGKPFNVQEYATCVFATNELPKDTEQTKAFFRRFLIIPFDVRIPDEEQDPDLAEKIIRNEMSGVLNYVVQGVKSLLSEHKFAIPSVVQEAVKKFQQESDSVLTFLDEYKFCPSISQYKTLQEMYGEYKKFCGHNGYHPVSNRTFSQRLTGIHQRNTFTL
jgi:putative DNA primase/helicase